MYAARSGAGARLFRLLIGGLIGVSAAAQFALTPVMPLYARRLDLPGLEQGLVLAAVGISALAVSLPAGRLSDRFGPRRITLAAGIAMAAATAGQAVAGDFPALFASRLVFGAGYGMVWTAGLCWLAGAAAGGPPALGGSVTSAGVGGVAGPALSGLLVQHFGLAVPLLVTAGVFAAITAGLAGLQVAPGPAAPRAGEPLRLRARSGDAGLAGAAAAVVTAGLGTGVCALLVPVLLHAAGASAGQTGLVFAISGILFAAGSGLTAAAGRRAISLTVTAAGIAAMAAAFTFATLSTAPVAVIAMLCLTTAIRSVLWTVAYPLAAEAGQGTGVGAAVGLLNMIWAATAVLGPLGAALSAGHLGARAAFGLTQVTCLAALAVTVVVTWRARRRQHAGPHGPLGSDLPRGHLRAQRNAEITSRLRDGSMTRLQ
jgi:MFS family permease